jgi:hypothetical protein
MVLPRPGDLGAIQVEMIAALAADELEHAGVAAFHPAISPPGATECSVPRPDGDHAGSRPSLDLS